MSKCALVSRVDTTPQARDSCKYHFSTCNDYDPYQPSLTPTHSHPQPPQGGRGTDHDHGRWEEGGVRRCSIYIQMLALAVAQTTTAPKWA